MSKRVLVLYDSITGNTKKMAEEVAKGIEEVEGVKASIKHVDVAKPQDLLDFDGLVVGSPTHCGAVSWKLKRFFDESAHIAWNKVKGKIVGAFSSSGGLGGGNEMTLLSILSMLMNYGYLVFGLPDYSGPGVTGHYGAVTVGKPGHLELEVCRILGRQIARYVRAMSYRE